MLRAAKGMYIQHIETTNISIFIVIMALYKNNSVKHKL